MSFTKERLEQLTPEKKALLLKRLEEQKKIKQDFIKPVNSLDSIYPLSFAQQRLWFLDQLEGPSATYNIPFALRIKGNLNIKVLTKSFNEIIRRHDVLRTNFIINEEEPKQIVHKHRIIEIENVQVNESNYQEFALIEAHRIFGLANDILMRVKLLNFTEGDYLLLITIHHIVSDGWSTGILIKELTLLYDAYLNDRPYPLNELTIQYSDFTCWQREKLNDEVLGKLSNYWKNQLKDALPMLPFPTDYARPSVQTTNGDIYTFYIEDNTIDRLSALSQKQDVTLFMTMLTAFYILIKKYSQVNDISIGTSIANRTHPEIENLIGFFVNTLVLRTVIDNSQTFKELLIKVKEVTIAAYEYQDMPFDELVKIIQPERNMSHTPLFQIMFELQNSPQTNLILDDMSVNSVEHDVRVAKFDMVFTLDNSHDKMRGLIEYNTDLFCKTTIEKFAEHYKNLLISILSNENAFIVDLQILSPSERNDLLFARNESVADFPLHLAAHELFEQQVQKTPHAIAVSCDGIKMKYLELEQKSNQFAHALLQAGVHHECRIGLFIDRSIDYLIAMLAVLKAGAAFVPLDPKANIGRSKDIVDQCEPFLIITSHQYTNEVHHLTKTNMLFIDDPVNATYSISKPNVLTKPNHLAYVIFTSGSTGKPKGVMIEHKGMVNHLYAKIQDLGIKSDDVIGQIAVQTFDVSIWQFLCATIVGGRTAILSGDHAWEPRLLLKKIEEERITILESVPSHTKVILDAEEENPGFYDISSLRLYITNAEPLPPEQCHRWFKCYPSITMVNAYGATECSDDTHHFHIPASPDTQLSYMPVRNSLPNLKTYLLDEFMELVPEGVRGEVYIGGVGVGRGYFNDRIKTASSYVPNPFSMIPGDRLYRTGDIARINRNGGVIEFLGRSDFQIKINGFRIEIGEIESVLLEHFAIESVVVLAKKDDLGKTFLVSYVIPKNYPAPTRKDIQKYCENKLPHYMVPSCIIFLDIFPLSPNGKVDRKRLPEPAEHDFDRQETFVAPRNTLENTIATVWSDVLHKEKIGIHDNFFKLGGHSLLAAELAIKLQKELGIPIALRKLFEFPTIELLAKSLAKVEYEDKPTIETLTVRSFPKKEFYHLAPCQVPEWYAYQLDRLSPVYNISFTDLFYKNLNVDIFVKAWQVVLDRHQNFRIYFDYQDGQPIQKLLPPIRLNMSDIYVDQTHIQLSEIDVVAGKLAFECSNIAFQFETGPLFSLKIAAYPDNQYQLLFVIHHIIWDETSTINLFQELAEIYNALLANKIPQLPNLELNYFDYIEWMNESIKSGTFEKHRQYWLNVYHDLPPVLDLPTDYPRPPVLTFNGDYVTTWLPREFVRKLNPYLEKHNVTLFMFMMAIIDLYLFRITGQNDIVIGSPIAGRDHESFKPLLGLFASPMPIRCHINEEMVFLDLLNHIKEKSLEAYEHHYYPSNLVIEELNHVKDLSRPKLFSIMYGVQNNKTEVYESTKFDGAERFIKNLYGAEANSARFDLTLVVDQWGSDIAFNCIFNTDLFKQASVQRMMEHMTHLVLEVIENTNLKLTQYNLISSNVMDAMHRLNDTKYEFSSSGIHELFEQQALKTPHYHALVYDDKIWSYQELNVAANQLAHYLQIEGVKPDMPVGVILQPSANMMIALLAILKLSAHYVPISVDYPLNRIEDILQQADISHLLSDKTFTTSAIHNFNGKIICLDNNQENINRQSKENLGYSCLPDTLAYIIFTSGTTGKPKGIPIHHHGVVNLLFSTQRDYQLTDLDSILALTTFTFDASILELFWPLAYGAKIVIPRADVFKNPLAIAECIQSKNISVFQCVPIMLEALIDTNALLPSLRLVISGGAFLSKALRDRFYNHFTCKLVNHYGPTEVTVDASRFDCAESFVGDILPIGKPIANVTLFIIDHYGNIVPEGVVGEICVGSPGLTKGYLHDESKTHQSFFYQLMDGENIRLYKTGDLGKLSDDGNVYYIGRKDNQIKIRGNRVELEEIEGALLQHPSINNAAVRYFTQNDNDGQLVAYLEYHPSFNSIYVLDHRYQWFTVAERPELLRKLNENHTNAWPAYFEGSQTLTSYWPKLYSQFPDYQFGLLTMDDELAAFGNAAPIYWDGIPESLPKGWDAALIESLESTKTPNTLLILAGIVTPSFQSKGLSTEVLTIFKNMAKGHKLERIVVAVRPTGKIHHPELDFETWCTTRREDGQLVDNWLRIHERVGGKLLQICLESQYIEGTINQWEQWTGQSIPDSGMISLNETLQPACVDREKNIITYFDPAIWVEHYSDNNKQYAWEVYDSAHFRAFLTTYLPAYMIPEHYYFLSKIPLLESHKINEKALPMPKTMVRREQILPKTMLQRELVTIWKSILKIENVGITDDFFELGGQSLKVIQMLVEIKNSYQINIPLCLFYKNPTVKGLEVLILSQDNNMSCG